MDNIYNGLKQSELEKIKDIINSHPLLLPDILKIISNNMEEYKRQQEKKQSNAADIAILILISEIMILYKKFPNSYEPPDTMKRYITENVIKYHFPDGIEGKAFSPCEVEFYKKHLYKE